MTSVSAESRHDRLIRRLSTLSAGATAVQSVDVKEDYWPDDRPTQIVLHLSEPKGDTWEVEDIIELRRKMNDVLADEDVISSVRTTLAGGDPIEDEPVTGDEDQE